MYITDDIKYVGVNDHKVDLFEGQYIVKNGMAYNSYVIMDEKVCVVDTVDINFTRTWLDNIASNVQGRKIDYLLVQHMEPDHSASIDAFMSIYPQTTVVASGKALDMIKNFFHKEYQNTLAVAEGDSLALGKHTLHFVAAPMVHWPEVIVSYDDCDKVLFSADGFGKFGALDVDEPWDDEARRYYIGIVGKYGPQVQNLLAKAATLDIKQICATHGPVLNKDLGHYIEKYKIWSSYEVEEDGIVVAYTSIYGNTKKAVDKLVEKLKENGANKVVCYDLARCDMHQAVADAFRYSKLVLATTTYNADIFPYMRTFIHHLTSRNFQFRMVALMENGSWAPTAGKVMKDLLQYSKIRLVEPTITIKSAMDNNTIEQMDKVVTAMCEEYIAIDPQKGNKTDKTALFKLGYGLYVITTNDGKYDNGMIANNVVQLTDTPNRIAVTINKTNYTCEIVQKTGILNVNCLSTDAPFAIFQRFGFQSGRQVNKFTEFACHKSTNGLAFLERYINAYISLKVENEIDFGTHMMFVCSVEEAVTISKVDTMTYTYYQSNVKPKPVTADKKGWVCKVCGYIYEGEDLPEDFICPLCKHGVSDFEKI